MPTPSDLESSTANNCQLTRRELTAQKIAQTPYHYIYLPRSPVFHCRDCKLVLNSKEFFGSIQYRTAAKKRRPCKVCNPTLEHFTAQETAPSEGSSKQDSKKAQQVQNPNEVIQVRLLGNHFVSIRRNLLVGCCHNRLHPGKLTQKLMEEHECLRKNCRYFEKYEGSCYWRAKTASAKAQRKAKELKKLRETTEQSTLELFQSYADTVGYPLQIVRVQEEKTNVFKIYYVSENTFRDGNCFPNFLSMIQDKHPRYRISTAVFFCSGFRSYIFMAIPLSLPYICTYAFFTIQY